MATRPPPPPPAPPPRSRLGRLPADALRGVELEAAEQPAGDFLAAVPWDPPPADPAGRPAGEFLDSL